MRLVGSAVVAATTFILVAACESFGAGASTDTDAGATPNDASSADVAQPTEETGADGSGASTTAGLLALWRFDETGGTKAADDGPTNATGTLEGSAQWTQGQRAGAFDFNGSSFFTVSKNIALAPRSRFTFACWLQYRQTVYNPRIFALGYAWHVKLEAGKPVLGSGQGNAVATLPLEPGQWTHLTITFAEGQVQFFADGVLRPIFANALPSTFDETLDDTKLGSAPDEKDPFNGLLDDMRLYDRVLSASEIEDLAK